MDMVCLLNKYSDSLWDCGYLIHLKLCNVVIAEFSQLHCIMIIWAA